MLRATDEPTPKAKPSFMVCVKEGCVAGVDDMGGPKGD